MRESFAEWKIWTKKRIKQRRKDARKVKFDSRKPDMTRKRRTLISVDVEAKRPPTAASNHQRPVFLVPCIPTSTDAEKHVSKSCIVCDDSSFCWLCTRLITARAGKRFHGGKNIPRKSGIPPGGLTIWTRCSQRSSLDRALFHIFPSQALREAWHDYEAEGVVSVMAEWKVSFWEEEYDAYNDTQIWRHKLSGVSKVSVLEAPRDFLESFRSTPASRS